MIAVDREATIKHIDDDFDDVTYHLRCQKCGDEVTISYAHMIGGVNCFLARKPKDKA